MKEIVKTWLAVTAMMVLAACVEDDSVSPGTNLPAVPPERTDLDVWIKDNYTDSYNIEVIYKWRGSLTDESRYLYPPHVDSVRSALEVVKRVWIDQYTSIGGENFVKNIAPRQIVLIGGINRNTSGTITLGLAEGGKRITLFNVDLLERTERASMVRFMQTVQHEYAHILNQTKPFAPSYGEITPEGYTSSWFDATDEGSREEGFITAYARAVPGEDFAEMVSEMLTRSRASWDEPDQWDRSRASPYRRIKKRTSPG